MRLYLCGSGEKDEGKDERDGRDERDERDEERDAGDWLGDVGLYNGEPIPENLSELGPGNLGEDTGVDAGLYPGEVGL